MRKYALLAAAATFAIGGSVATAGMIVKTDGGGFQLTAVDTGAGTGALAGDEVYSLYALNMGTGPTAGTTSLESIDAIVTGLNGTGLIVRTLDNQDGTSTADFDGIQAVTPHGSYIRAGTAAKWFSASVIPPGTAPNATYPDPTSVSTFEVAGLANFSGSPAGVAADATQNAGKGALFGQVVVKQGGTWQVTGQYAAGGSTNIDPNTTPLSNVPEPASLSMLGLGIGGLMVRRRRA